MKVYRSIVIILAIILGLGSSIWAFFSPNTQMAINDKVTEEDYELLKEDALKVAKTLDKNVLNDETLTADFYFDENKLVVTVESKKAKIIAEFPITKQVMNIEDGIIQIQENIEVEHVEYAKASKLLDAWLYIVLVIFVGAFVGVAVYFFLYASWFSFLKYFNNNN